MVGPPRPGEASAQLEQRRAENEERLLADELEAERNATHRRGEWMTQLPKLHKRGEGVPTQRAFSHTDVTVKQDAAWTAAPHNRAEAMANSARERNNPAEPLNMEALAAQERDARIGAMMDQYHQKHRAESLVEAHTRQRTEKRKEREERRSKVSSSSSSSTSSEEDQKKRKKKHSKKHSSSSSKKKKSKKKRSKKRSSSSSSSSDLSIPSIGPGSFDRDRDLSNIRVTSSGQVQKLVNDARSLSSNFGHGSRRFL